MKQVNTTDKKELSEELLAESNSNGYKRKIYKTQADEHKTETLQREILLQVRGLEKSEQRDKVNFKDPQDVKNRTYDYLEACAAAGVFPSIMGLAVHGYGISRQALNQYLHKNEGSESAEFILKAKDVIADILVNSSLYNNANPVQAIFQLKNHFQHADRVELEPIKENIQPEISSEEIIKRYGDLPI